MEVEVPLKNEEENNIPLAPEPNEPEQTNVAEIEQPGSVPSEDVIVPEDGRYLEFIIKCLCY